MRNNEIKMKADSLHNTLAGLGGASASSGDS